MAANAATFCEDYRRKFQNLTAKFTSLVHGRSEGDRQQINILFDELNALDFKTTVVNNSDKAVLIINQCCSIVLPHDTFLVAKGCQLISNLINKQHVKVEGKTLPLAVSWCTQSLKYCGDIAIVDILQALEALLRGNGSYIEEQLHELIGANGALRALLNPAVYPGARGDKLTLASPWEVKLMTVRCIEALTFSCDTKGNGTEVEKLKLPQLESCAQIFMSQLYIEKPQEQDEILYCKVLISSLRGLQNILQQCPELRCQLLGEALGMVKTFMLYGLHGYSEMKPQKIFPANLYQCDITPTVSREGRGGKGIRVRKKRQKKSESNTTGNRTTDDGGQDRMSQMPGQSFRSYTMIDSANSLLSETTLGASLYPTWLKTSDSDFSDTEAGQAAKARNTQGRVRQAALTLLLAIIKVCERKVLFGYWSCLLPDAPNMQQSSTLCTCLLKDPLPRNRMLVLQVLTLMLVGSRLYLSQAESSNKSSMSFTPFSVTVGSMVKELHHALFLTLSLENSVAVIILLLKCLAALTQNTPYHRLEPGLITKIVTNVKPYLKHKDATVQVSSLTVLGSVVAIDPRTQEITDVLVKTSMFNMKPQVHEATSCKPERKDNKDLQQESNMDSDYEEEFEEESNTLFKSEKDKDASPMSWLLEACLRNLGKNLQRTVKVEETAPRSAQVKVESLQVLTVLSRNYFSEVMSNHLGSLVQVLERTITDTNSTVSLHSGRAIDALGSAMQQCLQDQSSCKSITLEKSLQFWQIILSGPLISLIQNAEQGTVRAVGCDCLAAIGGEVFEQLPRDKQILIITLLFGSSNDEENNVRASAVRALAMCIMFPTLQEDIHFITDTAECVMRTIQDESLLVRTKASWTLGNMSDTLVLNLSSEETDKLPNDLLLRLMETSIKASQDNDKVRSNAVRAVGNFVRLVTEELMKESSFKESTEKAITVLVKNATTGNDMKVRWNACYAIGNMMKNSALYSDHFPWQNAVFSALSKLVQDVRNFKVRINAALALSMPSCRQYYGAYYIGLWTALINGLENSQNMDDFSEYKHRDNLLDQICLTLSHLASLATKEDLAPLHDILTFHLETLQQHFLKFHERVVPEKAGALSSAASHAATLLQLPGLSSNQHSAAALLTSVFLQDTDTF